MSLVEKLVDAIPGFAERPASARLAFACWLYVRETENEPFERPALRAWVRRHECLGIGDDQLETGTYLGRLKGTKEIVTVGTGAYALGPKSKKLHAN